MNKCSEKQFGHLNLTLHTVKSDSQMQLTWTGGKLIFFGRDVEHGHFKGTAQHLLEHFSCRSNETQAVWDTQSETCVSLQGHEVPCCCCRCSLAVACITRCGLCLARDLRMPAFKPLREQAQAALAATSDALPHVNPELP